MANSFSIAVCQMQVGADKNSNLKKAGQMIHEAAGLGADMVILPEMFNITYNARMMAANAEYYPGNSTEFLARAAEENRIILVGGSIAEKDPDGSVYNTSFVFDEKGQLIGRHRKIHLFDIDIPGKATFKESSVLSAGNNITVIKHQKICFSLLICYDCRFPELFRAATSEGAQLVVIPAAFTIPTGSMHWDLIMRCRAVDHQVYIAAASPARTPGSSYQPWGHSMIVDPWGSVLDKAETQEKIITARIDLDLVNKVREELPIIKHRRLDLYETTFKKPAPI